LQLFTRKGKGQKKEEKKARYERGKGKEGEKKKKCLSNIYILVWGLFSKRPRGGRSRKRKKGIINQRGRRIRENLLCKRGRHKRIEGIPKERKTLPPWGFPPSPYRKELP